jgi:penicillin amidase
MKALRLLGAVLLVVAVVLLGTVLWYRKASQPTHEGSLAVSGIGRSVTIARDALAIPYIDAGSEADALYALGYVHAQDRLWQMTFNRRVAQGRIAELAGPAALDTDRFLRTLCQQEPNSPQRGNPIFPTRFKIPSFPRRAPDRL